MIVKKIDTGDYEGTETVRFIGKDYKVELYAEKYPAGYRTRIKVDGVTVVNDASVTQTLSSIKSYVTGETAIRALINKYREITKEY